MKATEKQIEFIRAIEEATGIGFDYQKATKESASEYISKNIGEYKLKTMSNWALENGYY